MCLFHKWEKWRDPEEENWVTRYRNRRTGIIVSQQPFVRITQKRRCEKCGKIQTLERGY